MSGWPGRLIASGALCLSGAVHALVLAGVPPVTPDAVSGSGARQPEVALLGNAFADLAAGGAVAVAPAHSSVAHPSDAVNASPAQTLRPVATSTRLAALPDAEPKTSPRPAPRPPRAVMRPQSASPEPAMASRTRGNAERDAKRGDAEGRDAGRSATRKGSSGGPAAAVSAQAAAERYAALVIRKIRSTPQRRGSGRGKALVGFGIRADGGLEQVRLLRSSGSAALDAAALDHIRRAAPFAPPPDGPARFSFEFVARN